MTVFISPSWSLLNLTGSRYSGSSSGTEALALFVCMAGSKISYRARIDKFKFYQLQDHPDHNRLLGSLHQHPHGLGPRMASVWSDQWRLQGFQPCVWQCWCISAWCIECYTEPVLLLQGKFFYLYYALNKNVPEKIDYHCSYPLVCFEVAKADTIGSNHSHPSNDEKDGENPSNEIAISWPPNRLPI